MLVLVLRVSQAEPHGMLCAPVQMSYGLAVVGGRGVAAPPAPGLQLSPLTMGKGAVAVNLSC